MLIDPHLLRIARVYTLLVDGDRKGEFTGVDRRPRYTSGEKSGHGRGRGRFFLRHHKPDALPLRPLPAALWICWPELDPLQRQPHRC